MNKLVQFIPPVSWFVFGCGMGINILILALMAGWAMINKDKVMEARYNHLSSKTAIIEFRETATLSANYGQADVAAVAMKPAASIKRTDQSLPPAPIKGLYERLSFGILPLIRAKDGFTPFHAYKKPVPKQEASKKRIALGIYDLGLSEKATESAIRAIPSSVSLILSPYAPEIDVYRQKARAAGHEVWLSVPLENTTYPNVDTGSQTIFVNSTIENTRDRVFWALSRTAGYTGLVSNKDHKYTVDQVRTHPLFKEIKRRGLGYLESNPSIDLLSDQGNPKRKIPYIRNSLWIDENLDAQAIIENLKQLEQKATEQGHAVGLLQPYPLSYQIILKWIKTLQDKNIEIVPLSALSESPRPKSNAKKASTTNSTQPQASPQTEKKSDY